MRNTYITVRTQFEGYHKYPGAGEIDPRIKFLEYPHRHLFKVEATISVEHLDRNLEFFLVKWSIEDFIKSGDRDYMSCEMIADGIVNFLHDTYGDRYYKVTVSEDGESDGIVEFDARKK